MLKWLAIIGILLNTGIFPANAKFVAASLSAKRSELRSVQAKISAVDQHVDHLQTQQEALQHQLADLEKKMGLHASLLNELQQQINVKNQAISKIDRDMRIQTGQIEQQKKILKNQVLAAYHSGQQDHLKLALKQEPVLSNRLLSYYDYLNKRRLQKVKQLESAAKPLLLLQQQHKQALELLDQQQQRQRSEQAHLLETKNARAQLLQQLHNKMSQDNKLLGQLKNNEHALKLLLIQLQKDAKNDTAYKPIERTKSNSVEPEANIESSPKVTARDESPSVDDTVEIDKSHTEAIGTAGKAFAQLKGNLPWPVAGSIHKRTASDLLEVGRGGVLIDAPEGSPVHAVASGQVVYAGWMRGYGLLTIVNHGGGFMTIYAYNQNLYKKVGSKINAGEVIASVGQSGGQSNDRLYFEIRKQGHPLSPEAWCKK